MSARALGGGPLREGSPVRFVYVDEAGTSDKEPLAAVVGVIVHADNEWRRVGEYLDYVRDRYVPPDMRRGFAFHATELFSGGKRFPRDVWPLSKRLQILKKILSIPRKFNLPLAYGYSIRGDTPKYTAQQRHQLTFASCLVEANKFIKANYDREVAMVVAEDAPAVRSRLAFIPRYLKGPYVPAEFSATKFDVIVDSINFADKRSAPFLQIADHVAFAMRRYLSKQSHGDLLMSYIKDDLDLTTWSNVFVEGVAGGRGVITPFSDRFFSVEPPPWPAQGLLP